MLSGLQHAAREAVSNSNINSSDKLGILRENNRDLYDEIKSEQTKWTCDIQKPGYKSKEKLYGKPYNITETLGKHPGWIPLQRDLVGQAKTFQLCSLRNFLLRKSNTRSNRLMSQDAHLYWASERPMASKWHAV